MNSRNSHKARQHRLLELVALGFILLVGAGFFYATRFEDFLGYTVVLLAAIAPIAIWIGSGTGGIPILPTGVGLYWLYFGLPTLRGGGERAGYSPQHVLEADVTVALFLIVTTVVWARFLRSARLTKPKAAHSQAMSDRTVVFLAMFGLGMGLTFYAILYSSFESLLGSALGVVRAVLLAPMLIACYFLGYGKAKGMFSLIQWIIALAVLTATLVLQIGGLQLISGATEIGAALIGYVYTARKVPWITTILVAALISILQAGKVEIRDDYANIDVSAQMTPLLIQKWFETGLNTISRNTNHQSVSDRASLLPQMIRVQTLTPDRVPYLDGESYTYLAGMLVPRILNPNRGSTQVVMNLLDVRYGFLTREETRSTAVGVNIVPEAFANFGYLGVIAIGIFFGIFTGYFTRISISQEATSLPTLFAIAAMVTVINLEADLSYLMTTFFQSAVAVTVFYYGLRFMFGSSRPTVGMKEVV